MIKAIDPNMKENTTLADQTTAWFDLNRDELRGVICHRDFTRLGSNPMISKGVDALSKHPSGLNITFNTDSSSIKVKASLIGAAYMAHMTSVATVGFDLYVKIGNRFVFLATTKVNASSYEVTLLEGVVRKNRTYRLYFPLYQAVTEASLGLEASAHVEWVKKPQEKLVIYGTSISQGGCASRPGLSYGAILDRHLPYEVINLGFSGSAHLEDGIVEVINSISKKWLILEVEANNDNTIAEMIEPFLQKLNPGNIVLISHFPLTTSLLKPAEQERLNKNRLAQQAASRNIIFVDGAKVLKRFGYEETVDGVHLNDIGFYAVANYLERLIRKHDA